MLREIKPSWSHSATIHPSTLKTLGDRHSQSLHSFQIDKSPLECDPILLNNLEDFGVATLHSCSTNSSPSETEWATGTILKNARTLRYLTLGRESRVINIHSNGERLSSFAERYYEDLVTDSHKETETLSLTSLRMIGLAIHQSLDVRPLSMLRIEVLQYLILESCVGTSDLLLSLSRTEKLRLRRFRLREEHVPSSFASCVEDFLSSFSGLEHLSILLDELESPTFMPDVTCFCCAHGATLKTLVWEGRTERRTTLKRSTSVPRASHWREVSEICGLIMVCNSCPNLEELGWPIDWDTRRASNEISFALYRLDKLRTLNLRVLPEVSTLPYYINMENFAFEMVRNLIDRYLHLLDNNKLRIICVGAFTLPDARLHKPLQRTNKMCKFLVPRIFYVEYPRNILGKMSANVTLLEEGTLTVTKSLTNYTEIFEPCWVI